MGAGSCPSLRKQSPQSRQNGKRVRANPVLSDCSAGILIAFPKGDIGDSLTVKLFAIDRNLNVLKDDQEEEDHALKLEKEQLKRDKKSATKRLRH